MSTDKKSRDPILIFTPGDGSPPCYIVECPDCHADLSSASVGRIHHTLQGPVAEIFHPLRCGECGAWLLEVPQVAEVWRPAQRRS